MITISQWIDRVIREKKEGRGLPTADPAINATDVADSCKKGEVAEE